uniref:WD repeat domain 25 n=1 Tax=Mus musculus TaxID=10090 RepID=A0A1Y7VMN7_MOUSE
MASLVAYDDSDSETEADPARSGDAAGVECCGLGTLPADLLCAQ